MAEVTTRRRSEPRLPSYRQPDSAAAEAPRLSVRERQILEMLVVHGTAKQAAAVLGMSQFTLKNHLTAIYAKLGVRSRAGAVVEAVRRGLIRL